MIVSCLYHRFFKLKESLINLTSIQICHAGLDPASRQGSLDSGSPLRFGRNDERGNLLLLYAYLLPTEQFLVFIRGS